MILEGLLGFIFLGFIFYFYFSWRERRYSKKLLKNYDENEDKSKQGEEESRKLRRERRSGREGNKFGGLPTVTETEPVDAGLVEFKGRELLQTTKTIPDGKTSNSNGKSNKLNRILTKLRRR